MLKTHMLATSAEGRSIHAYELENESPAILIVGGMHGDEPQSAFVADRIVELLQTRIGDMMNEHLVVVPQLNPDGLERGSRKNSREVDINRNFPTANWCKTEPDDPYYGGPSAGSEPETQLILGLIRQHGPRRILTVHCIDDERQCVNYDGPAEALARAMAKENGYEVRSDIGHATPGSLGAWAGYERQILTITLELPAGETDEKCWQDNRDAVMSFIQAAIE